MSASQASADSPFPLRLRRSGESAPVDWVALTPYLAFAYSSCGPTAGVFEYVRGSKYFFEHPCVRPTTPHATANTTAVPAGGGPVHQMKLYDDPPSNSNGKAPMSAEQLKGEEVGSELAGVLAAVAEEEAREAAEEAVQVARDAELAGRAVSEPPSSVVESEWVKVSSGAGVEKIAAAPVEGSNPFSALSVASADPDPAASADPNPAASAAKPESPVVPKPPKKRVGQTDDELLDAAIAEKSRALRGGTAPEPASPPSDPEPTRPSGRRRGKRSAGSVRDRRRTTRNRRRERVAEVVAPSAPSAAPGSHPAARSDRPSGALAGRRRNERQQQHGAGRERPVQAFVEHATTGESVPWFGLLSASVGEVQARLFPRMGRVRLQLGRGPHFPEESTLRECGVGALSTMRATMLLPGGADDEPHAAGGSPMPAGEDDAMRMDEAQLDEAVVDGRTAREEDEVEQQEAERVANEAAALLGVAWRPALWEVVSGSKLAEVLADWGSDASDREAAVQILRAELGAEQDGQEWLRARLGALVRWGVRHEHALALDAALSPADAAGRRWMRVEYKDKARRGGRLYPSGVPWRRDDGDPRPVSTQGMPADLRPKLTGEHFHDIDGINSDFVIYTILAREAGFPPSDTEQIRRHNEDRARWQREVAEYYSLHGSGDADALVPLVKRWPNKLANGSGHGALLREGGLPLDMEPCPLVRRMATELHKLKQKLLAHHTDFVARHSARLQSESLDAFDLGKTLFSLLVQTKEAEILQIVTTAIQQLNASKGFEMTDSGVLMFDGHMFALHPSFRPEVALDVVHASLEEAGYGEYRQCIKPNFGLQDEPVASAVERRRALHEVMEQYGVSGQPPSPPCSPPGSPQDSPPPSECGEGDADPLTFDGLTLPRLEPARPRDADRLLGEGTSDPLQLLDGVELSGSGDSLLSGTAASATLASRQSNFTVRVLPSPLAAPPVGRQSVVLRGSVLGYGMTGALSALTAPFASPPPAAAAPSRARTPRTRRNAPRRRGGGVRSAVGGAVRSLRFGRSRCATTRDFWAPEEDTALLRRWCASAVPGGVGQRRCLAASSPKRQAGAQWQAVPRALGGAPRPLCQQELAD